MSLRLAWALMEISGKDYLKNIFMKKCSLGITIFYIERTRKVDLQFFSYIFFLYSIMSEKICKSCFQVYIDDRTYFLHGCKRKQDLARVFLHRMKKRCFLIV